MIFTAAAIALFTKLLMMVSSTPTPLFSRVNCRCSYRAFD
jgi:hypothetical protein